MPRSEREIFNDHVTTLVRQLGVDLEDLSARHRRDLLSGAHRDARDRHLNDHEAALAVAYGHVPDLLEDNVERARVLIDRLALVADEWHRDELVDARFVTPLERDARARLRRADR